MPAESIDAVQGRASLTPSAVWAARLADKLEEIRARQVTTQSVASTTPAASVATTPVTAAIYTQAAQYQMYTHAGGLSSLEPKGPANAARHIEHPEELPGVEGTTGASVNTVA
jgi:hypothetical protein